MPHCICVFSTGLSACPSDSCSVVRVASVQGDVTSQVFMLFAVHAAHGVCGPFRPAHTLLWTLARLNSVTMPAVEVAGAVASSAQRNIRTAPITLHEPSASSPSFQVHIPRPILQLQSSHLFPSRTEDCPFARRISSFPVLNTAENQSRPPPQRGPRLCPVAAGGDFFPAHTRRCRCETYRYREERVEGPRY